MGEDLGKFFDKFLIGNEDDPIKDLDAFKNSYYSLSGQVIQNSERNQVPYFETLKKKK